MNIEFLKSSYSTSSFRLSRLKKIIKYIIDNENYELSSVSVLFVNKKQVIGYNRKFLNHNYPTDIITFSYSEKAIFADLIICIPVIKDNAKVYKKTFINELYRVVIHGILHVTGYDDKTKKSFKQMKKREDYYLDLFKIK